jgi:ribosomal RNA-processing protein 36
MDKKLSAKRPCRFFAAGKCTRGDDCTYSHTSSANGLKGGQICREYTHGKCTRSEEACRYAHDDNKKIDRSKASTKTDRPKEGNIGKKRKASEMVTPSSNQESSDTEDPFLKAPKSDDDDAPVETSSSKMNNPKKKSKAEKNKPLELSSKKPVKRYEPILAIAKKHEKRDPRFDAMTGEYKESAFRAAYSFIDEYRDEETKILEKARTKVKSKEKKAEVKEALAALKREKKSTSDADRKRQLLGEWKKQEFAARAAGKKPFFLKDSETKKLVLADQFLQIKKQGNLNKVIEKKREKRAKKDRRYLPPKAPGGSGSPAGDVDDFE